MRYFTYYIEMANGELETIKVPRIWLPFDVAEKFSWCLVYLKVPRGQEIWTRNRKRVTGPATVLMWEGDHYWVLERPRDGAHSHQMFKHLQANGFCRKQEETA